MVNTIAALRQEARGLLLLAFLSSCAGPSLGRRFPDPAETLKIGFDRREDVIRKMGSPYRVTVGPEGRELLVYLWADGRGQGEKCVVGLNADGVVYVVERLQ